MNYLYNYSSQNMEKKKSQKKINKTSNSNKKEGSPIGVKNMLRQIGELKKELISIKSKKHLQAYADSIYCSNETNQKQLTFSKEKELSFQQDLLTTSKAGKQNINIGCTCGKTRRNEPDHENKNKKVTGERKIKIDLMGISCTKQRQIKLKVNIQISKIKSALEKLLIECEQSQPIELIAAQSNVMMTYLNSIIKDYEKQISDKKHEYKEMRTQLSSITTKVLKLTEGQSSQKNLTTSQLQEIAELKRYLSYYMQLMQDNKVQAEQCTKDYADLQIYVSQLQQNNEILKNEIKLSKDKIEQLCKSIEKNNKDRQNHEKKYKILESDLQLSKLQGEKNRDKRKQIESHYANSFDELKKCNEKLAIKQSSIGKLVEENKQFMQIISNLKDQHTNITIALTHKKIETQKLERKCSMLALTLDKKQQVLTEREEELLNAKTEYERQIKQNKKLIENLQFCQIQIDNLCQQIDDLKRANQKYKNQLFRNKLIKADTPPTKEEVSQKVKKNVNHRIEMRTKKQQNPKQRSPQSLKSKHRQKILGEIQQLIERYKKSSDSQQQDSGHSY